jgi:5-methylcytosine-specific restriction protein A
LACEACGFDFAQTYGECGEGYVECHHCRPLSEVTRRGPVRLDEVALVCANCHRMLHRGQSLMSVAQLQAVIRRV